MSNEARLRLLARLGSLLPHRLSTVTLLPSLTPHNLDSHPSSHSRIDVRCLVLVAIMLIGSSSAVMLPFDLVCDAVGLDGVSTSVLDSNESSPLGALIAQTWLREHGMTSTVGECAGGLPCGRLQIGVGDVVGFGFCMEASSSMICLGG